MRRSCSVFVLVAVLFALGAAGVAEAAGGPSRYSPYEKWSLSGWYGVAAFVDDDIDRSVEELNILDPGADADPIDHGADMGVRVSWAAGRATFLSVGYTAFKATSRVEDTASGAFNEVAMRGSCLDAQVRTLFGDPDRLRWGPALAIGRQVGRSTLASSDGIDSTKLIFEGTGVSLAASIFAEQPLNRTFTAWLETGARYARIRNVTNEDGRPWYFYDSRMRLEYSGFFVRVGVGVSGRVLD